VESVPSVLLNVTLAPPELRLFPLLSFNWIVIVDVLAPFATMVLGDAEIWDVDALAFPAENVTTSASVIATPPRVPVMVEVPTVVVDVNVAV
jgi:hypothetical protein